MPTTGTFGSGRAFGYWAIALDSENACFLTMVFVLRLFLYQDQSALMGKYGWLLAEISETNLMVSRPRPSRPTGWSRHRDRDRDSNFQSLETETFRDSDFLRLSRPRLIETKKFLSCRDRDSSRLANLVVVETETHRDWTKVVETETLTRLFQKIFWNSLRWPLDDIIWLSKSIFHKIFDSQGFVEK